MANASIVPVNIEELLEYRTYIIGACRRIRVPDLDDAVQDILVHCMVSNFFPIIKERRDAGDMTPGRFKSYLSRTISNCLHNRRTSGARNPVTNAYTIDYGYSDDEESFGVQADTLLIEENNGIPNSVLDTDLMEYVSRYRPYFLPTVALQIEGYRPPEISDICNKRKETIHYRLKIIQDLVSNYLSGKKPRIVSNQGNPPSYTVQGINPYPETTLYHQIYNTLAEKQPLTLKELSKSVSCELHETPAVIVGRFLADGMIRKVLIEDEIEEGQEDQNRMRYIKYRILSEDNPYRGWGSGHAIFERLKEKGMVYFTHTELSDEINLLIQEGKVKSKRDALLVAWNFIDSSRNAGVLSRNEDGE